MGYNSRKLRRATRELNRSMHESMAQYHKDEKNKYIDNAIDFLRTYDFGNAKSETREVLESIRSEEREKRKAARYKGSWLQRWLGL